MKNIPLIGLLLWSLLLISLALIAAINGETETTLRIAPFISLTLFSAYLVSGWRRR